MSFEPPNPFTPPDCDLRNFAFMPLDVLRLRDSDLAAIQDAEAFRAAVIAWCVAWHQVPAASLPDDDATLCRLLGYGRDLAGWRRTRDAGALQGFTKCSDGRLYHHVVAEKALDAWQKKQRQRDRSRKANAVRWGHDGASQKDVSFVLEGSQDHPTRTDGASNKDADQIPQGDNAARNESPSRTPKTLEINPKGHGEGERDSSKHLSLRAEPHASNDAGSAAEPAATLDIVTEALAAWEAICTPTLARIRKLTASRRCAIVARLREDFAGDLDQWRAYLRRIVASPMLTGAGNRGWRADLDWVLEPQNLNRILEGRYDPPGRTRLSAPQRGAAPLDSRYWDRPPAEVVMLPKPELGTPERDAWDEAAYGRSAPPPAALRGVQAA